MFVNYELTLEHKNGYYYWWKCWWFLIPPSPVPLHIFADVVHTIYLFLPFLVLKTLDYPTSAVLNLSHAASLKATQIFWEPTGTFLRGKKRRRKSRENCQRSYVNSPIKWTCFWYDQYQDLITAFFNKLKPFSSNLSHYEYFPFSSLAKSCKWFTYLRIYIDHLWRLLNTWRSENAISWSTRNQNPALGSESIR